MCFWAIEPTLLVFNIDPQDERTPLHLAKDAEVVRVLVDAGANVIAKDKVRKCSCNLKPIWTAVFTHYKYLYICT